MIDSHCHLLPALDDGPTDLYQSMALAHQLIETGIHTVICTPHYSRRFRTDHDTAVGRLVQVRDALAAAEMQLELHLAAELASATALEVPQDELPRWAFGGNQLLVELESDTPAGFVNLCLERLCPLGYVPVFAHPERCRAVRLQPRVLDSARANGARVQVVAPSLVGKWGRDAKGAAWQLIESGRADILASDSHHARQGGLHIATALKLVADRFGSEALQSLTEQVPGELIAGSQSSE